MIILLLAVGAVGVLALGAAIAAGGGGILALTAAGVMGAGGLTWYGAVAAGSALRGALAARQTEARPSPPPAPGPVPPLCESAAPPLPAPSPLDRLYALSPDEFEERAPAVQGERTLYHNVQRVGRSGDGGVGPDDG